MICWLPFLGLLAAPPVAETCRPDRVCELPLALSPAAAATVLGARTEAWWARSPRMFGNAIGLSVGWGPAAHAAGDIHSGRILLAAGRLESDRFREATAEATARARGAGAEVRLLNLNAGHDFGQWEIAFAEALVWMFPPAR